MIPDLLKTITILLVLISGYLIVKKINELEHRVIKLEKPVLKCDNDNVETKFEEEYSTDNFINFLKKSQLGDITIMDMKVPSVTTYQNCENQNCDSQYIDNQHIDNQYIDNQKIDTCEQINEPEITEAGMTEVAMTETVFNISDTDSDNLENIKKYTNMKLAELQKLSKEYNIDLKLNGKNKTKKLLIKEIISHLTNNG
jgi:hypothetical protein